MINKKILYVGPVAQDSSSFSRYKSIKEKVKKVDIISTENTQKIFYKIKNKLRFKQNKNIINHVVKVSKNYDLLWLDKPSNFNFEILEQIKTNNFKIKLVCHVTDDIDNKNHNWEFFKKSLSLYDYIFTCNKFNISKYSRYNFFYNELGYEESDYYYNPVNIKLTKNNFISFYGHYEEYYKIKIKKISKSLQSNIFINMGGQGWWKSPGLFFDNRIKIQLGWVSKKKMINNYRNSIASIGLYSSMNRNLTSGRIFELAALGVPIIAEGNYFIDKLLEDNYIKLIDDTMYLNEVLKNEDFLNKIRLRANKLILEKKCSWSDRVSECFKVIGYE